MEEIIREALLENGRIVPYDIMSRDRNAVKEKNYVYLGCGTIYRINGQETIDKTRKHFWARRENVRTSP